MPVLLFRNIYHTDLVQTTSDYTKPSQSEATMKFTALTAANLLAFTSLSTSQPLPDHAPNKNVVPIRWNDVEAGVHAAQSSASAAASASVVLHAREAAPAPAPAPFQGPRKGKSGAEVGGHRGGSGLWGREPAPEPEPKKNKGNKPKKKIESANVFDQGGDHGNDPSWG